MLQSLLPAGVEAVMAPAAGWLLTYLLHSTALIGAVWLLDRWRAVGGSPRLRTWMWTTATVGGLATATLAQLGHSPDAFRLTAAEAEKAVVELTAAGPAATAGRRPPGGSAEALRGAAAVRVTSPHADERHDPLAWVRGAGHDWPYLLVLGALFAAFGTLTLRAGQLWRLARRLRDRRPVRSASVRAAMADLRELVGGAGGVRVSRARAVRSPLALPGREICLPPGTGELSRDELKALLAHELVHVRRRDPATLLALAALEATFALQPLNRVARRRLTQAIESRTDDRVRGLGLGVELASTLVTVGAWVRDRRPEGGVAGLARESDFEARVRRLLEPGRPSGSTSPAFRLAALSGTGALLGAVLLLVPGAWIETPPHATVAPGGGSAGSRPVLCRSSLEAPPGTDTEDCSVPGPTAAVTRDRLADGPGLGLYVSVADVEPPLRLRLRPGRAHVRWRPVSGREILLPLPSREVSDGRVVTLRVSDPPGDEHVLYLPPAVRRLTLVVDGRVVRSGDLSRDGELPRLVAPDAGAPPNAS